MIDMYDTTKPLPCPMCGEPDSFLIHAEDESAGTCWAEKKVWRIKPGPNAPKYPTDGEILNWLVSRRFEWSYGPKGHSLLIVFGEGKEDRYRGTTLKETIYFAMMDQTEDETAGLR